MAVEALRLSVVVPSHRRVDLLALCLESVIRFAPAGTQIIVVDDGSSHESVSSTAATFPDVAVLRFEKAQGFCRAANAGIAAATGEVVELLNDDAEVTDGWSDAPLAAFSDRTVAAVAPLVLQNKPGPVRIDSAGDEYDAGGFARKRLHDQSPLPAPQACKIASVSACAAFYRRSALVEVGGFPEEFGAYFDDVDLSCRLRQRGYELLFEPSSRVWHRVSATYGRNPTRGRIEQQSRNEEWLYWRNAVTHRTLPRHAAVLAGKALRRIEEGTFGPWLAGRLRALTAVRW
jgi:GT2 family glycosyltransferase